MPPGPHFHFPGPRTRRGPPAGLKLFPPLPTATFTVTGCRPVAVNTSGEPASGAFAVSVWVPRVGPGVRVVLATPFDPVVVFVGFTEPPPTPTAQTTGTIGTPLPWPSRAMTLCGIGSGELIAPVWLSPAFFPMWVGKPGSAVEGNLTGEPISPAAVACTAS